MPHAFNRKQNMKNSEFCKFFNLKEIRDKYGLTQKQMANLIFIDLRSYQKYESGERIMPRTFFELLKYKIFEIELGLTDANYKAYADTFKP